MAYCDYNRGAAKVIQPQPSGSKPHLLARPLISKPKPIYNKQIYSKEVEISLKEVCTKLQSVKNERDIMEQMARVERWVNGWTNFEELKMLQWYDYSACPKKYLDFNSKE